MAGMTHFQLNAILWRLQENGRKIKRHYESRRPYQARGVRICIFMRNVRGGFVREMHTDSRVHRREHDVQGAHFVYEIHIEEVH
jgi:hypothetical protein